MKQLIKDKKDDINSYHLELNKIKEDTKDASNVQEWMTKLRSAFEKRHEALHTIVASLATHINLTEKESKETKTDSLYLKKSVKDKKEAFDWLVTKKDIKPL